VVLNKIVVPLFFSIFIALFVSGVQVISEPVKLTPYDIIFVIFCIVVLMNLLFKRQVYITLTLGQFIAIFLMLLCWHMAQTLRSDSAMRAITLLLILVRDGLTVMTIATFLSISLKQNLLSSTFFNASILALVPGLLLFLVALSNSGKIAAEPYPGLIYRAGEGLIPHFQGFNHNPIYFATLSLLSIMNGIFMLAQNRPRKPLLILSLLILIMAFFMAFQRGPLLVLMMMVILTPIFRFLFRWALQKGVHMRGMFLLVLAALLLLIFVRLPYYEIMLFQRIMLRFQTSEWNFRFDRWSQMLSLSSRNPLIGYGLREAEVLIGGQFVENSYIEILYDQGLIGLVLWIMLWGYVFLLGVKKSQIDPSLLPWFYGWWLVLLSMGYISMHYDPLTWVLAGIIVGWQPRRHTPSRTLLRT
jgi:O-antigen ligase